MDSLRSNDSFRSDSFRSNKMINATQLNSSTFSLRKISETSSHSGSSSSSSGDNDTACSSRSFGVLFPKGRTSSNIKVTKLSNDNNKAPSFSFRRQQKKQKKENNKNNSSKSSSSKRGVDPRQQKQRRRRNRLQAPALVTAVYMSIQIWLTTDRWIRKSYALPSIRIFYSNDNVW